MSKKYEIWARLEDATPAPWGPYSCNYPFYVEVTKPAPSLSKHDSRPTYWRMEDGVLVVHAVEDLGWCLAEIYRLEQQVETLEREQEVLLDKIHYLDLELHDS